MADWRKDWTRLRKFKAVADQTNSTPIFASDGPPAVRAGQLCGELVRKDIRGWCDRSSLRAIVAGGGHKDFAPGAEERRIAI